MIESFFSLFTHDTDEMKMHIFRPSWILHKFSKDKAADLNAFLEWWDDKGCEKALYSPDDQDAIRILQYTNQRTWIWCGHYAFCKLGVR